MMPESTFKNALKLASFHTGKKRVVAFRNSFHGRTSAAVEVTDNPALHAPINTNHNVYFADLDIKEVETELTKGDVCAVILEGISGVGGIQVPDEDGFGLKLDQELFDAKVAEGGWKAKM